MWTCKEAHVFSEHAVPALVIVPAVPMADCSSSTSGSSWQYQWQWLSSGSGWQYQWQWLAVPVAVVGSTSGSGWQYQWQWLAVPVAVVGSSSTRGSVVSSHDSDNTVSAFESSNTQCVQMEFMHVVEMLTCDCLYRQHMVHGMHLDACPKT